MKLVGCGQPGSAPRECQGVEELLVIVCQRYVYTVAGMVVGEFRRHALWCPQGRPAGMSRLDLFPDYSAFPVWTWATVPGNRGRPARSALCMIRAPLLGISDQLAADLQRWADWRDSHSEWGGRQPATDEQRQEWSADGLTLAERLAAETGADVVYHWPVGPDGGDPACTDCGERTRRQWRHSADPGG